MTREEANNITPSVSQEQVIECYEKYVTDEEERKKFRAWVKDYFKFLEEERVAMLKELNR